LKAPLLAKNARKWGTLRFITEKWATRAGLD
jgi:hypothetical protein